MKWYISEDGHKIILDDGTVLRAPAVEIDGRIPVTADNDSYLVDESIAKATAVDNKIIRISVVSRPQRT